MHTYQLCWFSQESPNFSSRKVRALNLLGNTYHGLFQNFFINFVILEISKRKIKQGVDLALLLKLFSIGKCKTEQSNWYIFYESSIVILVRNQPIKSWCGFCTLLSTLGTFGRPSGDFQRVFRHVENDILTMQRFLDVSRFLYPGGWQVWKCIIIHNV